MERRPQPQPWGERPRHNGACHHRWAVAPESGAYVCRACGRQQAPCPHTWVWYPAAGHWRCGLCHRVQPDQD